MYMNIRFLPLSSCGKPATNRPKSSFLAFPRDTIARELRFFHPPLNLRQPTETCSYFRLLKYLYHDRTSQENCREIENRRTNLKSPLGDLGVVLYNLSPVPCSINNPAPYFRLFFVHFINFPPQR